MGHIVFLYRGIMEVPTTIITFVCIILFVFIKEWIVILFHHERMEIIHTNLYSLVWSMMIERELLYDFICIFHLNILTFRHSFRSCIQGWFKLVFLREDECPMCMFHINRLSLYVVLVIFHARSVSDGR